MLTELDKFNLIRKMCFKFYGYLPITPYYMKQGIFSKDDCARNYRKLSEIEKCEIITGAIAVNVLGDGEILEILHKLYQVDLDNVSITVGAVYSALSIFPEAVEV